MVPSVTTKKSITRRSNRFPSGLSAHGVDDLGDSILGDGTSSQPVVSDKVR